MISPQHDDGSATVEFIGLTLILLIPAIYLLLTISQLQAAGYAVVAASDQAAKTVGFHQDSSIAQSRAYETVSLTVTSYSLDPEAVETSIQCSNADCTTPGTRISVHVAVDVRLPLIPTFLGNPTNIATMSATGYHVIGEFE